MQRHSHLWCSSFPSCDQSHLAQNHDVAIIDNLATERRKNIELLLDHRRVSLIGGAPRTSTSLMEVR
ncbi:MAG: hypothetical protein CVV31_12700 [Methanomicrobiales archaeon HGW-Methanomicrobiales-2]|nr:MAG: hypothetical protein CVV31_12700 [Methanomicrobiales archaeon HGW-Methanomicrobiales-2]